MSAPTYPLASLLTENPAARATLDAMFAACGPCGGDGKIRCEDPECYVCAMDGYCENAKACPCRTTSSLAPVPDEQTIEILPDGTILGGGIPRILTRGMLDPGTY